MVKVINFGSLNIDIVYLVDHIVRPGETINSEGVNIFPGGKGLNQSISLSKSGSKVFHAGIIGDDGDILKKELINNNVDIKFLKKIYGKSGNAIIQVDKKGQNSILLYQGANKKITHNFVDDVMKSFNENDWIVLQNEINLNNYIIESAFRKKMKIALNPSPYNEGLKNCDLKKVNLFLLNEIEGKQITGFEEPDKILSEMHKKYPESIAVLTLGSKGSICQKNGKLYRQNALKTSVVDTTAAGDTFSGYFISTIIKNGDVNEALKMASIASAIAISRKGASVSIPSLDEVLEYKKNNDI